MKKFIWCFLLAAGLVAMGSGVLSAEVINRSVVQKISVHPDGSAAIEQSEMVPESSLKKIYDEHGKMMTKDKKVEKNFLDEIGKGFYLRFGTRPTLKILNQKLGSGEFVRAIEGKVQKLAAQDPKDKSLREIGVKKFDSDKKEKDMLSYFEYILDGTSFENMFLVSQKGDQTLMSKETTAIILPPGSSFANLKDLNGKSWKVDFGGGNVMDASLAVDEKNRTVTLNEIITVTEQSPKNMLNQKNDAFFTELKDYAAFNVQYRQEGGQEPIAAEEPQTTETTLDYSNSWNFSVSHTFSYPFTYSTLTVTPSAILSFNLGASVYWDHYWKKVGFLRYSWTLRKFEASVSANPSLGLDVEVTSGGSITKDWDTNIITKSTTFSFFVSFVPVVIALEAKLDMGATATISGQIGFNTGITLSANTKITCKYENSAWSGSFTRSFTPTFNGFTANARVQATARGEAPFTISAYLYYVAGPFAKLTPYLQGDAWAQAGSTTQVGYKIVGGLDVDGGVSLSGWLKDLLGGLGTYSKNFYTYQQTIKEGAVNITPTPLY